MGSVFMLLFGVGSAVPVRFMTSASALFGGSSRMPLRLGCARIRLLLVRRLGKSQLVVAVCRLAVSALEEALPW
jgi:hypothetical protein